MTAAMPLIALRGCELRFGGSTALRAIDFSLDAGERVALVGANGSGKTTLLRLLHGQLTTQLAKGERVASHGLPQAMVFQRPFLLRMSVWRNLQVALWLAGVPRHEHAQRARDALARVGLSEHAKRPARVLSGGQQQRLALARAWAVQPRILFLDEPTASLDPAAKREVEALIHTFAAEGITVVMSTHNLGQAKRLATRVVYLEAGELVVSLPTERFFSEALPERAAQFLKGEMP